MMLKKISNPLLICIQTVLTIIVNTGLVSVLVNLNYNSSLAHSLYLASVKIPDCKGHMHGEIVSLGVLLLLLVDKQLIQAEKVYDFNQKLDLPTSLMNLGIKDVKQIIDLILQDKYLSFAPYNITKEMIKEAIDMLETESTSFLSSKVFWIYNICIGFSLKL